MGGWELAGLTSLWRKRFRGTCHLESSEIDDRHKLLEANLWKTANTTRRLFREAFFLRLHWNSKRELHPAAGGAPALQFTAQTMSDLLQEALYFLGIV